jgi:hypothetical protein
MRYFDNENVVGLGSPLSASPVLLVVASMKTVVEAYKSVNKKS